MIDKKKPNKQPSIIKAAAQGAVRGAQRGGGFVGAVVSGARTVVNAPKVINKGLQTYNQNQIKAQRTQTSIKRNVPTKKPASTVKPAKPSVQKSVKRK